MLCSHSRHQPTRCSDTQNNLISGEISSSEVEPSLVTASGSVVYLSNMESVCTNDPQTLACFLPNSMIELDGRMACNTDGMLLAQSPATDAHAGTANDSCMDQAQLAQILLAVLMGGLAVMALFFALKRKR